MTLHVALRDGFHNDTVTIKVNGKEVYRKSGITTDLTISFADSVEVPVEGATARLEVTVEGGQRKSEEVRVAETSFSDLLREHPEVIPYSRLPRDQREWLVLNGYNDPSLSVKRPSVKGILD